jgi:hypothetical protein
MRARLIQALYLCSNIIAAHAADGIIRTRPSIIKATFLAGIVVSMGAWIWLLGGAIRWLIVKL